MKQTSVQRRNLMIAGAGLALAPPVLAQRSAGRVVKILVGFPPGQATDIVARLMADRLGPITGDNYVVENRPGQGGSIAMAQTARSPNDGSVMMLTHMSAVATNPHLYKSVGYDSLKDYETVGLVGDLPFVLVCHPSLPCNNVQELIAYVKANPGKLTNASSGNGTVSHLAMEEFKRRAGIDIVHVPYKGSAPGLADVVGGTVSVALETAAGVQAFVQGGKLRALGAATSKRLAAPLDVPTIAEQGFDNFQAVTWLMLIYPAGTPKPLVDSTFDAMSKAMKTPEVEQKLLHAGAIPRYSNSPAEADALVKSEFKSWGEVVKRSGVRLD